MTTVAKYIENHNDCPACGSDNVEGQSVDIDSYGAQQEVMCSACNAVWSDDYTLTGARAIEGFTFDEEPTENCDTNCDRVRCLFLRKAPTREVPT